MLHQRRSKYLELKGPMKLWKKQKLNCGKHLLKSDDNSSWQQAWQQRFQAGFKQGWQQYVMQIQWKKFPGMNIQMPTFNIPVSSQQVFPNNSPHSQISPISTSSSPR